MPDWVHTEIERMARHADDGARGSAGGLDGVERVTGQARAADGSITVVVSPGGTLRDVALTPAALRLGGPRLAHEIVTLAERAQRRASAELHSRLTPVLDERSRDALALLGLPRPKRPQHSESGADTTWLRPAR